MLSLASFPAGEALSSREAHADEVDVAPNAVPEALMTGLAQLLAEEGKSPVDIPDAGFATDSMKNSIRFEA